MAIEMMLLVLKKSDQVPACSLRWSNTDTLDRCLKVLLFDNITNYLLLFPLITHSLRSVHEPVNS